MPLMYVIKAESTGVCAPDVLPTSNSQTVVRATREKTTGYSFAGDAQ